MANPLTIITETGLQFDKNDIAAIAVAEAEKKMRMTIKKLRVQLNETDEAIDNVKDEIDILGKDAIDVRTKAIMKTIKAGLKMTKIKNLSAAIEYRIDVYPSDKVESNHPVNGYTISISINDENGTHSSGNLTIKHDSFVANQLQKSAMKRYAFLNAQKTQFTGDSLDWRRKLGDIGAMERQIKAALAKRQIESAKGGKELIKDLLKNFEKNLELLGD